MSTSDKDKQIQELKTALLTMQQFARPNYIKLQKCQKELLKYKNLATEKGIVELAKAYENDVHP